MYDVQLKNRCSLCIDVNQRAQEWAEKNAETYQLPVKKLKSQFRRGLRNLRKIQKALEKPMCVGVFGPSQAGKSYLLSTIAKGKDGKLTASFGNVEKDFLQEINPDGGKESTGLVTRFTVRKTQLPDPGFPVQLQLLSETDIVKIIVNSFFSDCSNKDRAESREEKIEQKLKSLESFASSEMTGTQATLDDIEELSEYVKDEFSGVQRVTDFENALWSKAGEIAPKLSLKHRVELYSLLWDEIPQLKKLLSDLLHALESLEFASSVYAKLDSLTPKDTSIIDVAQLFSKDESEAGKIDIKTSSGKIVRLPRWMVTALTGELTVAMRQAPDPIFESTDLLDFPGYRSRFKFERVAEELASDPDSEKVRQMFLRGKVAYLFQKYSRDKELTSMLLCVGPGNQEVKDLPTVIDKWIAETHGKSASDRASRKGPDSLFFVLTKADMDFEDKARSPDSPQRWSNRLAASLNDYFGASSTWPKSWKNQEPFKNVFLLRNPNVKWHAIMDVGSEGVEKQIRPDKTGYVNEVHQGFLDSESVNMHFRDPEKAWSAMMSLNDGGITYLKQALAPLCDKKIKEEQIGYLLGEEASDIRNALQGYYQSGNAEEEEKRKRVLLSELVEHYQGSGTFRSHFLELLQAFRVTSDELYRLRREANKALEDYRTKKSDVIDTEEEDESLPSTVDLPPLFGSEEGDRTLPGLSITELIEKDLSYFFAEVILDYWLGKLQEIGRSQDRISYFGFGKSKIYAQMVAEFSVAVGRTKMKEHLAEEFRKIFEPVNMAHEKKHKKQAAFAATVLNDFSAYLGYKPDKNNEPCRVDYDGLKVVFAPPGSLEDVPSLPEKSPGSTRQYEHFRSWIVCFYDLMRKNITFDGRTEFNIEQNQLLRKILEDVK